jgi:hypothetical protein
MKKSFAVFTSAACALGFLALAPTASAQADGAAKLQALSQQLGLSPKQKLELAPLLKQEAPKIQALKSNTSLSSPQKLEQLRAIHAETAPQMQQILTPAQYQKLQGIRQQEIQQMIAKKRAARGG